MSDDKTTLEELIEALSRERDELRVQLQLAKQEMRDKWEPLEDKWGSVESRMRSLGDVTSDAGKEVLAASKVLLDEIGDAYKDIWKEIRRS
ncbi:MAG: hypothetical protein KJO54_07190 [Gammaproteobacteria bacterium]|nr:hypothetical protein [Gammaproteobacteria bacterium]NNF62392.1 hypothetical protein [Gammaproteobacteria bacterium]NNM20918.1 hypothetical protein [Gammaproteobacteria bacterium]